MVPASYPTPLDFDFINDFLIKIIITLIQLFLLFSIMSTDRINTMVAKLIGHSTVLIGLREKFWVDSMTCLSFLFAFYKYL